MAAALEREIKLAFHSVADARAAVTAVGGVLIRPRRLQHDCLLDTADGLLRRTGSALRVRTEPDKAFLTFKGPVQPSTMKLREEIEIPVDNGAALLDILGRLGLTVWFRYEKYREEFAIERLVAAIDETPLGTYVELEGPESDIAAVAGRLGFEPGEYVLDSYRGLFARHCEARGIALTHMLFAGA
jgi:adenylate cyclase class 2